MTVHLEGVTIVSDQCLLHLRRLAEAARLAYAAGSPEAAQENLLNLNDFILGFNDPSVKVTMAVAYGRANLRDVRVK